MSSPYEDYLKPRTPEEVSILQEWDQLLGRCEANGISARSAKKFLRNYLFMLSSHEAHEAREREVQSEIAQLDALTETELLSKARAYRKSEDFQDVYKAACWGWLQRVKGLLPASRAIALTASDVWVLKEIKSVDFEWGPGAELTDFALRLHVLTQAKHERRPGERILSLKPDELHGPAKEEGLPTTGA